MRTRHQDGWVEERGTRVKTWFGHYYRYEKNPATGEEIRRHVGVKLGEKSRMRKFEAQDKLRGIITHAAKSIPLSDQITLEWYTKERFLPMREPLWAESTRETNNGNITNHILPKLGKVALADLDKFQCQVFLNSMAKDGFSRTVVDHCRTMLKAILEEAVEADLLGKNPARKLVNPETKEPVKFVLSKTDAHALLTSLVFRDRLIAAIAAFCALRPGEIFGLRWSSLRDDHFQIEGTAWRGKLRVGKAKTQNSKAPVFIPDALIPALEMWREANKTAPKDALIFPSQAGSDKPIRPENWLRRRVKPVAHALKIAVPVNFQVLRRTFATNAQGLGSVKDVQAHLRHTDIATTLGVYTQPIAESTRKLVNAVTNDVITCGDTPVPLLLSESVQ